MSPPRALGLPGRRKTDSHHVSVTIQVKEMKDSARRTYLGGFTFSLFPPTASLHT